MSTTAIDALLLGGDLAIPDNADDDALVTPSGDLALASGRDALRRGLRRRVLASPGDLIHRPTFGAGVVDFLETALTLGRTSELGNRVRRQALQDVRVADARLVTSLGLPGDTRAPNAVTLELTVRLRQSLGDEQLTVSYAP